MHLVATNLNKRSSEVYSRDTTPKMPVAEAIRRSMSIPLFFAAVREDENIFVDVGVLDNYPIRLFDRKKCVPKRDRPRHPTVEPYAKANRNLPGNRSLYTYNRETLGFRLDSR